MNSSYKQYLDVFDQVLVYLHDSYYANNERPTVTILSKHFLDESIHHLLFKMWENRENYP